MNCQNLIQIFEKTCQERGQAPCLRFVKDGQWRGFDWTQVRTFVQALSTRLSRHGLQPGDRVAILSKTRYEWTIADLAILSARGVTVPIYDSSTPQQVGFILRDCGAKAIFVENETQLQKLQAVWAEVPGLDFAILFDSHHTLVKPQKILPFDDEINPVHRDEDLYLQALQALKPADLASIVYTSGTTGEPKGAVLAHDNFLAAIDAGREVFHFRPDMTNLMLLPLSHILGRITQFYHLDNGFVQAYVESLDKIADNMLAVKPHFMVCVPRIFEKIYTRVQNDLQKASKLRKAIFNWSLQVGTHVAQLRMTGRKPGGWLAFKNFFARTLVFKKLHARFGGRFEFAVSGGAPLSAEIGLFFQAFGVVILEGYGLTETTAANAVNRFDATKMGTVGKPLPGVDIKIADDGEILIRGRVVFGGYFGNPQATAEAIEPEGWFHSGDIGEFDSAGFLKITDRKKDLIVTAGGKKIAPQSLENLLKTEPLISQAFVHGDKRKFLSALVTLNPEQLADFAQKNQIKTTDAAEILRHPAVYNRIEQAIAQRNQTLASFETIKKFAILPNDFSIATGELTPTLKLKRKEITRKYQGILDGFYDE